VVINFVTGQSIKVTSSEYILSKYESGDIQVKGHNCLIGFTSSPQTLKRLNVCALIGNTVLKRYYTIFEYEKRSIGFTLARGYTT
jgi:hypothetical protein